LALISSRASRASWTSFSRFSCSSLRVIVCSY
jgi:hypothetical protein